MSGPATRFVRRRLERGARYGLGFTLAFGLVVAALAAFAALVGAATTEGDLVRLDAAAHDWLFGVFGASRAGGLAVTWFGNNDTLVVAVVLVAGALVAARRRWAALRVVFASGLGGLVVLGLKTLFARDRPLDQVIPATGYSFPSGHAFASTVFYGMMLYLTFRLTRRRAARAVAAVVFPLVILAVGASRVYLNVHYPTDVLGGWLAGGAWLALSLLVVDEVETRTRSRAEVREERREPDDATPRPHGFDRAGRSGQ